MAEFTPGPWKVSKCTPTHVGASSGGICKFGSFHGMYSNYEANARLIAAAPELYEGCKLAEELDGLHDKLFDLMESPHNRGFDTSWSTAVDATKDEIRVAKNKIRNAIEKAEGKDW